MKHVKLFLLFILTYIAITTRGQNPMEVTLPRTASPTASVSQTIGISTVTVTYSRPSVRNRVVWGNLAHYGLLKQNFGPQASVPWRAGANENTVITFSQAAKVEGQKVPAGSYGLFFIVNNDNTAELILSKEYQSWGHFQYDAEQDQLRAKIQTRTIPHVETLTYDFINMTKNTAELVLNWEKRQFPVIIEFDVDEIVMANAYQQLKGFIGFNAEGYASAANYALANKVNNAQALAWIDVAIRRKKNFANLSTKARLLDQAGNKTEAEKLMAEAIALPEATEAELNAYGYQLLTAGQDDKAIEIFKLNTQRSPKSANAWDSLGEAYVSKGDDTNAIKCFKKSLTLDPPALTKANSEKFLRQLGALK
jgi:tetratricopeptide (TPR) repeat protein